MKVKQNLLRKSETTAQKLGRRLREVRGFDMTQAELARLLEISQSQLSKYEKGLAIPGGEFLIRLNDLFGVNIHWLLTGEGESFVPRLRRGH